MFGYDFLVDENYNAWILEINKSPSMDTQTVNLFILGHNQKFSLKSLRRCN